MTGRLGAALSNQLWRLRKQRLTLHRISDELGMSLGTVWRYVAQAGGVAPRARRRRTDTLTLAEREDISRQLAIGWSLRAIARLLRRAPSTVAREVERNGGRAAYRANRAEQRASLQVARPQPCKLLRHQRLAREVVSKLQQRWAPQQISRWLRRTFVDDVRMQVSHETIYRTLFVQTRGALRKELTQHLRTRRQMRTSRGKSAGVSASIVDGVSISERPASVEDRAVPGHWEGDLVFGTPSNCIATLVERATRYVMLIRIPSKDTLTVTAALKKHIQRLPEELRKSLTWDRGSELSNHKQLAVDADISIYFCDPASPWQRGSNENTNGLLRQYFPHGEDIGRHSQRHLDKVARELNGRPRETLGWRSPAEVLADVLR